MRASVNGKWLLFIVVTVVGLGLDVLTKQFAVAYLTPGVPVNVIGPYAQFLLVFNKAAIWGMDPRRLIPWFPLNQFFMVFTAVAAVVIVLYYFKLRKSDALMQWGISFVMPGALGNLWDRVMHAKLGVVDFIRLGISENIYWYIFNMADVYITIGVALMMLNFILEGKKEKRLMAQSSKAAVDG